VDGAPVAADHIAAVFAAIGGNEHKIADKRLPSSSGGSRFISRLGRGRWDRNRTCNLRFWRPNLACRVVSRGVATCRPAPRSLSPNAAVCRWVSSVTGADTGAASASAVALVPALSIRTAPANTCCGIRLECCSDLAGVWLCARARALAARQRRHAAAPDNVLQCAEM
jgi:hypothetical protein